jgi:CRISPR-associated protein (TIGR03986 family)
MAEIFTGKLSFDKGKWKIVFFDTKKQKDSTLFCQKNVFSTDFAPKENEDTEIHFERDNTPQRNAIRVRAKDGEWKDTAFVTQTASKERNRPDKRLPGDFHNPYNFVPAIPRHHIDGTTNDLGDRKPSGHDRFIFDKYTGKLRVKMYVTTPLLLPDTARVDLIEEDGIEAKKDHKIFDVRTDENGKPFIDPTAIKGMIRSAYEAITNSRLSVFHKHEVRLAFRGEAKVGAVPARVIQLEDRQLYFRVMKSQLLKLGFAAKLRRYQIGEDTGKDKGEQYIATTYDGKKYSKESLPQSGDAVWVQLNSKGAVEKIMRRRAEETKAGWLKGWVYVTGANISGKKNERVFIESPNDRLIKIEEKHLNLWRELIGNYQDIHKKDLATRENKGKPSDYLGKEPGKTAWSRHIYTPDAKELRDGTLCYLNLKRNSDTEIDAVIPVTISRRLFEVTPLELLPEDLRPATTIEKLSPADRVFGWVRQRKEKSEHNAYRGHLRIGKVEYSNSNEPGHNPIKRFDSEDFKGMGLPLQILGQPKPQQGRFYVAETKAGEAQIEKRSNEDSGFKKERGLRGRKVYPHHNVPEDYWTPKQSNTLLTENGKTYSQEYLRLQGDKQRDSQNRSIKGWVTAGTVFEFDINFINLSDVEIGALLWLLQLGPEAFHSFGGGKPFGFGSVHLDLTHSKICKGESLKKRYESFGEVDLQTEDAKNCISKFKEAVAEAYGQPFEQALFIKAFLKAATGFDKPIHYPRTMEAPNPDGESFEWFVTNNKIERGTVKYGLVLPNLWEDDGLPILPSR